MTRRRTILPAPWRRVDDSTRKTSAVYRHPSGYVIQHCGHPTALWPYALYDPKGELVLAPNGRAWQKVIYAAMEVDRLLAEQLLRKSEKPDVSTRKFSRRHP